MVPLESVEFHPPWSVSRPSSGGSDSCVVGSPLSLQMGRRVHSRMTFTDRCHVGSQLSLEVGRRGTQQEDLYAQLCSSFSSCTADVSQGYTTQGPLRTCTVALQTCHRGTQQEDLYAQLYSRFSTVTEKVPQGYLAEGPLWDLVNMG